MTAPRSTSSIAALAPAEPELKSDPFGGNRLVFESEPDDLDYANEILDPTDACGERKRKPGSQAMIPDLQPLAALRLNDVVVCLHQRGSGNNSYAEFTVNDVVLSATLSDDCSGPNRGRVLQGATRKLDEKRYITVGTAPVAAFAVGPEQPPYTGVSHVAPVDERVGLYAHWGSPPPTDTSSAIYITEDKLGDIPEPVLDIDACPDEDSHARHDSITIPTYDGPATTEALVAAFEKWMECVEEMGIVVSSAEPRNSQELWMGSVR